MTILRSETNTPTMSAAVVPSPGSIVPPARGGCWRPLRRSWDRWQALIRRPCPPTVLGPFVGTGASLDPANEAPHRIVFYGTDLGFSYEHAGRLQFLFGDTSATESGDPIQASTAGRLDDSFGSLDLAHWPDPARIVHGQLPRSARTESGHDRDVRDRCR